MSCCAVSKKCVVYDSDDEEEEVIVKVSQKKQSTYPIAQNVYPVPDVYSGSEDDEDNEDKSSVRSKATSATGPKNPKNPKKKVTPKMPDLESASEKSYSDSDQGSSCSMPTEKMEIPYTSNGFTVNQWKNSPIKNQLKQAECCQLYYKSDMFPDKDLYGVPGIITCLHCCFTFFGDKYYKENINKLAEHEREFLESYKKKYVDQHNSDKCVKRELNDRCILCETKEEIVDVNRTQFLQSTAEVAILDTYIIDKSESSKYVLSL